MKQIVDCIVEAKSRTYTVECLKEYFEDDPADAKKCTLIIFERSRDGKKSCTNTKEMQLIEAFPFKSLKETAGYQKMNRKDLENPQKRMM